MVFLDLLSQKYPQFSRERLLSFVLCGDARLSGELCRDPKRKVRKDDQVIILDSTIPWVSRGAYKLLGLCDAWQIDCTDKVVLDAGSSTGGFTQVLLERGAACVHAVDVGTNQLAYSLRTHDRVVVKEQTNILDITELEPKPDFAVADLSFTSIIRPTLKILSLTRHSTLFALIKPQFELQSSGIVHEDFDGVLDHDMAKRVLLRVLEKFEDSGIMVKRYIESVIKGSKGNQEYFAELQLNQK